MTGDLNNFGQNGQNQQVKAQWTKLFDLVHYNEQNQTYKTLSVLRTDSGNTVIQLAEGVTGQQQTRNRILFQLSEQELAYLAVKLQKLL